jgi:hypothetical protein
VHIVESIIDAAQVLAMSDELVNLELAVHVIVDEAAHLAATLDASESATLPDTAGDELECYENQCQ